MERRKRGPRLRPGLSRPDQGTEQSLHTPPHPGHRDSPSSHQTRARGGGTSRPPEGRSRGQLPLSGPPQGAQLPLSGLLQVRGCRCRKMSDEEAEGKSKGTVKGRGSKFKMKQNLFFRSKFHIRFLAPRVTGPLSQAPAPDQWDSRSPGVGARAAGGSSPSLSR